MKKCKYCKIRFGHKSNKGCCCYEHFKLWKQAYNHEYYGRGKLAKQVIKHAYIFKTCIDEFGEGRPINANFLEQLGIDWDLETDRVEIDNKEFIVIGTYAYLLFNNHTVIIKRL